MPYPYPFERTISLSEIIHSFPQLRLETLTILEVDPLGSFASFRTFQVLLQRPCWKTLIYISKTPIHIHRVKLHECANTFLQTEEPGFNPDFHSEGLGSKSFFQMKGINTGASFRVYRATSAKAMGGILDSCNRENYTKNKRRDEKGIMIVATRGDAAKAAKDHSGNGEDRTDFNHGLNYIHCGEEHYGINEYLLRIWQFEATSQTQTVGQVFDTYQSRDDI